MQAESEGCVRVCNANARVPKPDYDGEAERTKREKRGTREGSYRLLSTAASRSLYSLLRFPNLPVENVDRFCAYIPIRATAQLKNLFAKRNKKQLNQPPNATNIHSTCQPPQRPTKLLDSTSRNV